MTIEERAEKYMKEYPHMDDSHYDYYVKDGYIQGATDQQKIDIDKFCDLMITALNEGLLETSDIGKLNMWLRKAMDEEV